MIDATRSPRPLWRRFLTLVVVAALIGFLAWAIWVKELHHPGIKVHAVLRSPSSSAQIRLV